MNGCFIFLLGILLLVMFYQTWTFPFSSLSQQLVQLLHPHSFQQSEFSQSIPEWHHSKRRFLFSSFNSPANFINFKRSVCRVVYSGLRSLKEMFRDPKVPKAEQLGTLSRLFSSSSTLLPLEQEPSADGSSSNTSDGDASSVATLSTELLKPEAPC